jgi:hypothetical protein
VRSARPSFHFESIEDRHRAAADRDRGAEQRARVGRRGREPDGALEARSLPPRRAAADARRRGGGDARSGTSRRAVASPLRFLFNNPFERLVLDSVRVAVEVEPGREEWTLRGARVLEAARDPAGGSRCAASSSAGTASAKRAT